ncbi:MAG: hypothetical protein ABJH72_07170, partial [Reichenbachiella sp.]|uniref:hypothetical protein n=1 Tax=Reichenbachiella sp. TaxID=2184521 RepID=UPI00329862BA
MKKINIAFLSIFDLTKVFLKISERFAKPNLNCFWMTTNDYWTNYLLEEGIQEERIKQLVYTSKDFVNEEEKEALRKEIVNLEGKVDLNIFQSLIMDRFVLLNNRKDIDEFVYLYYRDIKSFLANNKIDLIIGEPTNFNELMVYMIACSMNIDVIAPRHMRYPSDRVIFTYGYLQQHLVNLNNKADEEEAGQYLEKFKKERNAPSYFHLNNKAKILNFAKIAKSLRRRAQQMKSGSTNHLTYHPLFDRIKLNLRKLVYSVVLDKVFRYEKIENIKSKIAYYGIHVQPEASIDVYASFFNDQLKLIKDIRRSLPFDFTLIVKEHPNGLGAKGLSLYRQIKKIPGVRLIKHNNSSFEIYEKCDLVFTVSGTAAYEAGMIGVPAIMFSPLYFNQLSMIRYCNDISKLKEIILELITADIDIEKG